MPNDLTSERVKDLYSHAVGVQAARNFVYAIHLFERVTELGDPFYTPFSLSQISQCYNLLGRRDLETETFKRVTELSRGQQQLLNPSWLALCYQRIGDLETARSIHADILKLTPHDPSIIAALAEISLLEGKLQDAQALAEQLRQRPEPNFQILGRVFGAFAFALRNRHEESTNELLWAGQFLISSGNIPTGFWDYRDLQPLVTKMGSSTKRAELLLGALSGAIPLPEFTQTWNVMTITLPEVSNPGLGAPLEPPSLRDFPDIKKNSG